MSIAPRQTSRNSGEGSPVIFIGHLHLHSNSLSRLGCAHQARWWMHRILVRVGKGWSWWLINMSSMCKLRHNFAVINVTFVRLPHPDFLPCPAEEMIDRSFGTWKNFFVLFYFKSFKPVLVLLSWYIDNHMKMNTNNQLFKLIKHSEDVSRFGSPILTAGWEEHSFETISCHRLCMCPVGPMNLSWKTECKFIGVAWKFGVQYTHSQTDVNIVI